MIRGFELAGACVDHVHLDGLIADPAEIAGFDLIGFPGGFSFGDDVASGRVFAAKCREGLYPALCDAAARGVPMIGVCNGFQIMAQIGLLPGPADGVWSVEAPPEQSIALTENAGASFIDDWEEVSVPDDSRCIWTRNLFETALSNEARSRVMRLPLASGEGRFVAKDEAVLAALRERGQIAIRYGENLNGSEGSIAGVCDPTGRIFGLMPHPDRYLDWTLHPFWTALSPEERTGETPGLRMFRNAVDLVVQEKQSGSPGETMQRGGAHG